MLDWVLTIVVIFIVWVFTMIALFIFIPVLHRLCEASGIERFFENLSSRYEEWLDKVFKR